MAKLLGLMMVFSCGALLGWSKALELRRQAAELGRWGEFLREFRVRLGATRASPRELAGALCARNAFAASPGIRALGEAFREESSFSACLGRALEAAALPREPAGILLGLADVVGAQPLEEQLAALEGAELLMAREEEAARERSRRYGGLWQRLGVLLGLAAAVLLA